MKVKGILLYKGFLRLIFPKTSRTKLYGWFLHNLVSVGEIKGR